MFLDLERRSYHILERYSRKARAQEWRKERSETLTVKIKQGVGSSRARGLCTNREAGTHGARSVGRGIRSASARAI